MKCRFISHTARDPYWNMAFDEWMLDKVMSEPDMLILRLYSWSPGSISFGLNQQIEKAFDHDKIGDTPIIRRATGGRAIFHDESELTYGLAVGLKALENEKLGKTISDSSQQISSILVEVLREYGIDSALVKQSIGEEKTREFFHTTPCFESVSKYEIVTEHQKIIASAQRRIAGSVLQHGSIKINGFKSHPALPLKDANILNDNNINIVLDSQFQRFQYLLRASFESYFSTPFEQLELSESEEKEFRIKYEYVKKNCLEKRNPIKQN